jgi:formate/nitrite transporter FocA (FNT family)
MTNLIPSTLGNTFAGVVCVALPYALLYGTLGARLQFALQGSSSK